MSKLDLAVDRYDRALESAQLLQALLSRHPRASRPQQLSIIVYAFLDVLYGHEPGTDPPDYLSHCPACGQNCR